ncbi:MAG: sialate O-acetylesterase [Verrucomicrobiota bacterium]
MKTLAKIACIAALALGLHTAPEARADVRMPVIFSDNMVLQQGMLVPVWGWADEGETVLVQFQNQRVSAKAKDGKWMVKLKNLKASAEPETMTISGKNRLVLQNILIGEVWVCSGQSNMEWPLNRSFEAAQDIQKSVIPNLRLFAVQKARSDEPLSDLKQPWNSGKFAWQESSPQSSYDFSAVGFYFGRALQEARGVPVGMIHTSWGGTPAEAWTSRAALEANQSLASILESGDANREKYLAAKAAYDKAAAEAKKKGEKAKGAEPRAPWYPGELYNAMLAPLIPYAIKGAIWYQGESNADRAYQYRTLFPEMIKNWRKDWGQGDFPFIAVQLAPWDRNQKRSLEEITKEPVESKWAELREAQLLATRPPTKAGMVVITDVGDKDDIHPTKKQPVGERLALAARTLAYNEKIVSSGPLYKNMRVKGNQAILNFDSVGGGLEAKDGELKGFAICGEDKKFVWGKAEIVGNTVVVTADSVAKPVAVRYGWADFPVVNLFNKEGLPATPFRTDDFPLTTAPK